MIKYLFPIAITFILSIGQLSAQPRQWSLEECIAYALEHNISIKQQSLVVDLADKRLRQSKMDLYPNLNASTSFTNTMGRVRDENTFQINDLTTRSGNLSLGSSTPIFEGFSRRNTIEKNRTDRLTAQSEVEVVQNNLTLRITNLYLQILLDRELLNASKRQLAVAQMQQERTEHLVNAGRLPEGNLLEMRSLVAREAFAKTQLENNLSLSLLDLAQTLDLEEVDGFDIQTPTTPELTVTMLPESEHVYNQALSTMPQIAISHHHVESSELDVEIARGGLQPRLSLNMGVGTNFSVYEGMPDFNLGRSARDNISAYYGVSLAIPIFNGLHARTAVEMAQVRVINAEYELEKQKQVLRKEIQQVRADADAAYRQYLAGEQTLEFQEESFRYTENRFNLGLISTVDYNIAKNEYMKAQSDLIQSKYAYILRLKILDFYLGNPIVL